MSEMVERIARKLCARHYAARFSKPESDPRVQSNVDGNWGLWADDARTAAEVMREPTAAMLDSGVAYALNADVSGQGGWTRYVADKHRAMIDAALRPTPTDPPTPAPLTETGLSEEGR